ncbi:hypothetical protein SVAN01_07970 [Stagonosporopsis vannaccii]|nr:hypothetical protein SVAN01_07970 [Stagonosporopsis vannaccii]
MRLMSFFIYGLASCLAASAFVAASPVAEPEQPQDGANVEHTLNIAIPPDSLSGSTLVSRGDDPSKWWQRWGAVEIWTGGSSRKPVNYGDTRGANLSDIVFALLDASCPPSTNPSGAGCCPGSSKDWQTFYTNALINDDPLWEVDLRQARVRIEGGCFHSEGIRIVLMQLAADALRAFTVKDKGYNCYDTLGRWAGTYCNVPQLVRVNLPNSLLKDEEVRRPAPYNYMHIETWSTDPNNQFGFTKGELRPCKTRRLVDEVMDKYAADILKLFPDWGWFHREAKVIINGYKDCTNEP